MTVRSNKGGCKLVLSCYYRASFLFSTSLFYGGSKMYDPISPNVNFVEQEKQIEKFWREHNIFESLQKNV